jgi:signal transduction histidine kinase
MVPPVSLVTGVVLGLGSVLGFSVAYVALRHRDHPADRPLAGIAALPAMAGVCYTVLVAVPDSMATRPLLAVGSALTIFSVGYFLLFTLAYTGRNDWLTPRRSRSILGVFGVLAMVGALDLLTMQVTVETVNGLTYPLIPNRTDGPVFLLLFTSSYASIFVGLGLLLRFLIAPRNMYRKQTAFIATAIGITVAGGVVFEAGVQFHPGLNFVSVLYTVEALLIALALFRYEFLTVEPLAPDVVLEQINDPVVVLDESDAIIDLNPAAQRLVDVSDPVGTPVHDLLPGLLGAAASGDEYAPPDSEAGSGGTLEMYDLNAAPISDQYDRDRGTVVVLRDVSLQKRRERTLEHLQVVGQRLLGAETETEVLEIAVTAAHELLDYPYSGAMLYDEDTDALRPASCADPLAAAFEDAPVDGEMVVQPGSSDIWKVFESGEPMLGDPIDISDRVGFQAEIGGSLLYPLGDHGVLGISAGPDHERFTDDDRRFADILASTTENALDRVEKERELRENRELLATRAEQIEFFNSVLRHDLLNGMQVVQAHVDILAERVDEDVADHVQVIDGWTEDIVTLTQNVRAVTGAVGGDDAVTLTPVDLGSTLSERVAKVRDSHETVSIDVAVGLDRLPVVLADDFLGQVFENLLGNAIEHSDQEHTEVVVGAAVDGDTVTVWIADNGPGIDDDIADAVFEQSVTSDDSGSVGFGLYFVRLMIDRYGGDIWFKHRSEWVPPSGRVDHDGSRGAVAVVELPVPSESGWEASVGRTVIDD